MTKQEALKEFRATGGVVRGDTTWTRENLNNYIDMLHRDRRITTHQVNTWTNPF